MGDKTAIAWTDATWNPIVGCSRVSEGCRHCYAEKIAARFSGPGQPYHGLAVHTKSGEARWTGKVRVIPERLTDPLRWMRPRRIFVNSMSDLFHEGLTDTAIAEVFTVMASAPQHTFQILTKRPERMRDLVTRLQYIQGLQLVQTKDGRSHLLITARAIFREDFQRALDAGAVRYAPGQEHKPASRWDPPNVWLGVSAEDQATADARIPLLLQTPAAVRFVSAEPLLGSVDLKKLRSPFYETPGGTGREVYPLDGLMAIPDCDWEVPRLDWLIVGGESGPGARPCDLAWIRSLVAQCRAAGTPVFVKQLGSRPIGEWGPNPPTYHLTDTTVSPWCDSVELSRTKGGVWKLVDRKGGAMDEWPADLRVQEWPR